MQKKQSKIYSYQLKTISKQLSTFNKTVFYIGIYFILIMFFTGCFSDNRNISYEEDENIEESIEQNDIMTDSSFMKMINMPIHFDSLDYIIYPLSIFKNNDRKSSKRSYDYEKWDYNSNYDNYNYETYDEYSGGFYNLVFQNSKTGEIKYLTDKRIRGSSFRYLREIYHKTGKKYLLLELKDADTNKDGLIDYKDITSLYICDISGNNFTKLSPENENLVNWKIDNQIGKIYFQTQKDINKDGFFDTADSTLLYFIDVTKNMKITKINFKL